MTKSRNGGFTLVELLVTITVGVIVTFAATTVLLLCLRVAVGGVVYVALCACWWRITGNRRVLGALRRNRAKAAK